MQLWLLDFDQGVSRGLEWTEGSVGSMLGEAGVQPNFWNKCQSLQIPKAECI